VVQAFALGQTGRLHTLEVDVLGCGQSVNPANFTAMGDIFPLNPQLHTLKSPANLELMRRIAAHAQQLQHLAMSVDGAPFLAKESAREGMLTVVRSCRELRTFHVDCCVLDELLIALGAHCPHLIAFAARFGAQVSDAGVCALAQGCRQLRELSTVVFLSEFFDFPYLVSPVTMVGITALATHCPRLRELEVHRSVVPTLTGADAAAFVVARLRVTVHDD
jgi:hypothetical protein